MVPAKFSEASENLFGAPLPPLATSSKSFDAAAVWAVVGPAMGIK
jgi:hypothetical protein